MRSGNAEWKRGVETRSGNAEWGRGAAAGQRGGDVVDVPASRVSAR